MADAALAPTAPPRTGAGAASGLFLVVAWRNVWRNPRRTWLTAGGIAFAIWLIVLFMSAQAGMYNDIRDLAARIDSGHAQVQHPRYFDDSRLRYTVTGAAELARRLAELPTVVAATPRAESFALVSADLGDGEERSYGAMVVGVDPEGERAVSTLSASLVDGTYLTGSDDAVVGARLARNLGVSVGDELVVLGSTREGGVAALAIRVGGILESGLTDLDRILLQVRLSTLQEAFELGDDAHRIVLVTDSILGIEAMLDEVRDALARIRAADTTRVLPWAQLMPEVEESIQLDSGAGVILLWSLVIVVAFAVVNALVMTVLERTREFGMLLAVGMRPGSIMAMLQVEALCMWAVGAAIGLLAATLMISIAAAYGIPMPQEAGDVLAKTLLVPERIRLALDPRALTLAPGVLGVFTLLAAFLVSLRLRRISPLVALREVE